jgi:diacylglycerol kinase (ATP)
MLIDILRREGHDVGRCASPDEWQAGIDRAPDLVAVVGGDGTVGQIARLMPTPAIPIAILPMGTANNIASTLGLTDVPIDTLIRSWPQAPRRAFDIGVTRGPWGEFRFLESVGAGLIGEGIATIDDGWASHVNTIDDQEQRIAAAFAVFRSTLLDLSPVRFELRLDGADLGGEYLLVEAMNFGAAGPNLQLSRYANHSDGLLDLVLVDRDARHLLHRELETYRSDPDRAPALSVHRGRRLELRCEECTIHMDDELWSAAGLVSVEAWIEPGALTFLVLP